MTVRARPFSSRSIKVSVIESEVIGAPVGDCGVGLEIDVEYVADHRNAPRDRVESYIDQQLEKLVVRHAETARLVDDEELTAAAPKSPMPGIKPSTESAPSETRVPEFGAPCP